LFQNLCSRTNVALFYIFEFWVEIGGIIIDFLPPIVTSVLQLLDHVIFASLQVQYKKNLLLEWVLSQLDSSTTHQD
jgi:hypothetical protein